MDLRQFSHLAALADHRNFVRAAAAVNLSQPALSRSIQTLERDLGCTLVERSSREFCLTAQGQLVLTHARRLLAGSQALLNELEQYNGLTCGELHFGSGPYPAQVLVPEALATFISRYPAIRIRLQQADWRQLGDLLNEQQIEFLVADSRDFVTDAKCQVQLLRPRHGRFFCRRDHPLASRKGLKLSALLDFPIVATRLPPRISKTLADVQGVEDFAISVECVQFDAVYRVVRRSDAIGIATMEALSDLVQQDAISLLDVIDVSADDLGLNVHYGVVSRAGHSLTPAAQAMIAALVAVDQQLQN